MIHSTVRRAFTLVELLVVIGIIALLMALLFPSLRAARRQADLVKCASNLRQIIAACQAHAVEHRGYFPLAGELHVRYSSKWDGPSQGLGDPQRQRYTYVAYKSHQALAPAPFPAAVAPYMGFRDIDFGDLEKLEKQINDPHTGVWKMFMCPSTDSFQRGSVNFSTTANPGYAGVMGLINWGSPGASFATSTDYGLNEGALGYHFFNRYQTRRLAGNTSRFANPGQLMILSDALPGTARTYDWCIWYTYPWIVFTPQITSSGKVTLADVLLKDSTKVHQNMATLDTKRHSNKTNVAFADGHVETLRIEPGTLNRVHLLGR